MSAKRGMKKPNTRMRTGASINLTPPSPDSDSLSKQGIGHLVRLSYTSLALPVDSMPSLQKVNKEQTHIDDSPAFCEAFSHETSVSYCNNGESDTGCKKRDQRENIYIDHMSVVTKSGV